MQKADIALLISGLSFVLSFYAIRRDNEKLKARSWFFPSYFNEDNQLNVMRRIRIEAVNSGRRPIILTFLGVKYDDGHEKSVYLEHPDGVHLNEKEKFTQDDEDLFSMLYDHENGSAAVDMWFEDTLGKRHYIKGAKRHLELYFKNEPIKKPMPKNSGT